MSEPHEQHDKESLSSQEETSDTALPPRHRFRPVLVLSVLVLLGLLIAGGVFTANRLTATGALLGPTPAPTLTVGSDQFYFEEMPSWGTISVDGHVLAPVPAPGTGRPLKLSLGVHQVVWHADPFPPVHCAIFLPFRYSNQNCVSGSSIQTFQTPGSQSVTASLISFSAAISNLPQDQLIALSQAAENALAPFTGETQVQAGEHFAITPIVNGPVLPPTISTATSPIAATLNMYVSIPSSATGGGGLCAAGGLIDQPDTCMNNGQSCFAWCPLTGTDIPTPVNHWEVLAALNPVWTYVKKNGQVVANYQDDPAEGATFLVALSISRNGSQWQVALAHAKSIDNSPVANPACDAARYEIGQDGRFLSVAGTSQPIYWKYSAGSNAAVGCVAEAFAETAGNPSSAHPLASCLYRFGIPLALDSEAHRSWPFLLQASPYEQSIAQQILSQTK
ncbi:MAG: hypothetical protein ABI396_16330 [Ktedonobacteraceae bacterium]